MKNSIFSGISITVAASVVAPLDFLKTQRQNKFFVPSNNYYRGHLCTLLSRVPSKMVYFGIYESLNKKYPKYKNSLNIIGSNIIIGILFNPLYFIQTRMRLNDQKMIDVVRQSYHDGGLSIFMSGISMTLPYMAKYLVFFNIYNRSLDKWKNPTKASFIAKLLSSIFFYPQEVIGTRLRSGDYKNLFSNGIWKNPFLGFGYYLCRTLPYTIITFTMYEYMKKKYKLNFCH